MQKLILDYSKWRCGVDSSNEENLLGEGHTALLNDNGYMCCLGQFALQLNPSLDDEDLKNVSMPSDLGVTSSTDLPFLLTPEISNGIVYTDSVLSRNAVSINDNTKTTVDEKIKLLKELFLRETIEIEVINRPENE